MHGCLDGGKDNLQRGVMENAWGRKQKWTTLTSTWAAKQPNQTNYPPRRVP